jgi:hypothetical protein
MPTFHLGILCGLVFGALAAASMLPMQFPDKKRALLAAFFSRFAIGICIGLVAPGRLGWGTGAVIGLLISLPDGIITKAYAPILGIGTVGGAVIGWILSRFGI